MIDRDTFLIALYVKVDTFCKSILTMPDNPLPKHFPRGTHLVKRAGAIEIACPVELVRSAGRPRSLCASEVITLAVYAQMGRFLSEANFYQHAQKYLIHLFPRLPDYSQFNRLVRQHHELIVGFIHYLVQVLGAKACDYEILDSTAVPVRHPKRGGRGWFAGMVDIGWSNRLGWYEGFHLLLSITPEGVITGYGFAEATCNDHFLADTLLSTRNHPDPRLSSVGEPAIGHYLADGGFQGREHQHRWAVEHEAVVITPPHYKSKEKWTAEQKRFFSSIRQLIETVNGKLINLFRLESDRLHTLKGFQTRLAAKIALHNFCIWLNRYLARIIHEGPVGRLRSLSGVSCIGQQDSLLGP